tara:strand:+ start:903 stop:1109 length:207 start_codon:yes stop_codon:yes gene_type:complete
MRDELDYATIATYIMIVLILIGFIYLTAKISGDKEDSEKSEDEIKEEVLESLDEIEDELEDMGEVIGG